MSKQKLSFEVWWACLKEIALEQGVLYVINWDDPEAYRKDDYNDGDDPEETLSIHCQAWADG